ncbi:chromate transporter [Bordetella sp. FB-8]|uniref:chromate transporter n=1 Tax=Bordetella sp. FB-8 TaxID=1159870 RepID=UPI0003656889|nr:chromate transporter [Bordetella sp. FB-8]
MTGILATLFGIFAQLSVLAFGGGNTVLPEMQRQVVSVHHWMTAADFNALFALSQAAPGPNMMIVALLGWHIAGLPGLLASTVGMFMPSYFITMIVMGLWVRFKDRPWRVVLQTALMPVTAGLVVASAWLITKVAANSFILGCIVVAAALVSVLARKVHPLWVLFGGAAIGLLTGFF